VVGEDTASVAFAVAFDLSPVGADAVFARPDASQLGYQVHAVPVPRYRPSSRRLSHRT